MSFSLSLFTSKEETTESLRRTIIPAVDNFNYDQGLHNLVFLTKLSAADRALIRFIISSVNLKSWDINSDQNRVRSNIGNSPLILSRSCRNIVRGFIQTNPLLIRELEVLTPNYEKSSEVGTREERQKCMTGRLMGAVPQVPDKPFSLLQEHSNASSLVNLRAHCLHLPVRKEQATIINLIYENRVVIIAGHRGCGKSTQIPQMLLEDCQARNQRCRVICTQPRRLAAHANADRVAHERGEIVGQSVGYQIRLESKVSPKTVLTFCTHGVLLRTIFADPTLLNATTHIIVDEIEEEDLFSRRLLTPDGLEEQLPISGDSDKHTSNLLLGILHRILAPYPHLRLILIVNLKSTSTISLEDKVLQVKLPLFLEPRVKMPVFITKKFLLAPQYRSAAICCLKTEQKSSETYFLEDILEWLDFSTPGMESAKRLIRRDPARTLKVHFWLTGASEYPDSPTCGANEFPNFDGDQPMDLMDASASMTYRNIENLMWLLWENVVLRNVYSDNERESALPKVDVQPLISDLLQSISVEWIPVDYKHSETGLTPLMLFAAAGQAEVVERLVGLGADVFERVPLPRAALPPRLLTAGSDVATAASASSAYHQQSSMIGANAYDLARLYGHARVAELLKSHMAARSIDHPMDDWEGNLLRFGCWFANPMLRMPTLLNHSNRATLENQCKTWAEQYASGFNKNRLYQVARNGDGSGSTVDFDLLVQLIFKLDASMPPGAILVFLPSYETIITLKEYLSTSNESVRQWWVFVLHPRMLVADLKQIFLQPPADVRKIILATDIAESGVSMTDISYVIDTGLIRKKREDSNTGVLVSQNQWISYGSAIQRQHVAQMGQQPKCFHLYSRLRLSSFEITVDEVRYRFACHAMEEVCLHAKLLTSPGENFEACFQSLPHVPDPLTLNYSLGNLRVIDAVDSAGNLTELGSHMCDLPLPPRYSKMVLVSIALKCVDPILTIACILASENPFTLPNTAKERKEAQLIRKKFSAESLSDHMVLLRAFQFWQKARFEGWEQSFCRKNYISSAVFDIVTTVRTQLLGQLRASGFVKARGSGDIRDLNTHSENWAVVKAALVAGMYDNLAHVDPKSGDLVAAEPQSRNTDEKSNSAFCCVRPSPLSVLATNLNDSSPEDLKHLPSYWLVYDKLIGQPAKGHECSKAKRCRKQNSIDSKELERKLLHCATVVSPFTTALVAGPMRCPIICVPSEETMGSESQETGGESLRNKYYNPLQPNLPLSVADIDRILKNFNSDVPRLESLGIPSSEALFSGRTSASPSVATTDCCSPSEQTSGGKVVPPKRLVILRLDGPSGILAYECELEVARLVSDLRQKWNSLLLRRLRNPGKPAQQQDEALLSTIVAVLSAEEQVLGLRQPTGVGARPRPMATELCNQNDTVTDGAGKSTTASISIPPLFATKVGDDSVHSLPQAFKQLPTCLSVCSAYGDHQKETPLMSAFTSNSDSGDCYDQDTSSKTWCSSLIDNFTQMQLSDQYGNFEEEHGTRSVFYQPQIRGTNPQSASDVTSDWTHPIANAMTDKSGLDNLSLMSSSNTNLFGSLRPLG